jgi:hypothetical protein
VPTSWDDAVQSMALESSLWDPHSLHTAEPTGFCQSYTIITMPLDLPGVLAADGGGRFLSYRYW